MRLALYEPDIPPNVGTLMRLCACLDVALDVIEPCGFPWDDRDLKRAAMDYGAMAEVTRHSCWESFSTSRPGGGRIVLLTTKAPQSFIGFGLPAVGHSPARPGERGRAR